ncbi:hypothetical protein ABZP36_014091 [Zizania latifolia]
MFVISLAVTLAGGLDDDAPTRTVSSIGTTASAVVKVHVLMIRSNSFITQNCTYKQYYECSDSVVLIPRRVAGGRQGNNKTIVIPLRGKLVLHNSGSSGAAAAQAAAGADDGGAAAHQAAARVVDNEHSILYAKLGWMMTVAALFVQTSFQAALRPPIWIPVNWFQMLYHRKPGADVAPSPLAAAATTLIGDQMWRVLGYVFFNTATFATAMTIMIV